MYNLSNQKNNQLEEQETEEIIRTGASRQPKMYWDRPLLLGISGALIYQSIDHLIHRDSKVPEIFTSLSQNQHNTLGGLILLCLGLYSLSLGSAIYFRSQIMTPPATKRSIWQAVTDYVTKPFHQAAPLPVESGVKYQTIDD